MGLDQRPDLLRRHQPPCSSDPAESGSQRDQTARHPRHIEQVVHQAGSCARPGARSPRWSSASRLVQPRQLHEHVRCGADRGQRIAQLMRQHGQEFILAPGSPRATRPARASSPPATPVRSAVSRHLSSSSWVQRCGVVCCTHNTDTTRADFKMGTCSNAFASRRSAVRCCARTSCISSTLTVPVGAACSARRCRIRRVCRFRQRCWQRRIRIRPVAVHEKRAARLIEMAKNTRAACRLHPSISLAAGRYQPSSRPPAHDQSAAVGSRRARPSRAVWLDKHLCRDVQTLSANARDLALVR